MASGSGDVKEEIVQGLRGPSFSPALAWSSESNPSLTSDLWPSAVREAQAVAVHSADSNSGTLSAGPGTGTSQLVVGGEQQLSNNSNIKKHHFGCSPCFSLRGASLWIPFHATVLSGPGRQLTFPKGAGTSLSEECPSHLLLPETN